VLTGMKENSHVSVASRAGANMMSERPGTLSKLTHLRQVVLLLLSPESTHEPLGHARALGVARASHPLRRLIRGAVMSSVLDFHVSCALLDRSAQTGAHRDSREKSSKTFDDEASHRRLARRISGVWLCRRVRTGSLDCSGPLPDLAIAQLPFAPPFSVCCEPGSA